MESHPLQYPKPPASSFSLLKTMLIAGPLLFVLLLITITVSIQKPANPNTPEILYQQESTSTQESEQISIIPPQEASMQTSTANLQQPPGYQIYHNDICGNDLQLVSINEIPQCFNSVNTTEASAYQTRYTLKNTTVPQNQPKRFSVTIRANSQFCLGGNGTHGSPLTCTENSIRGDLQTIELGPQEVKVITISRRSKDNLVGSNGSPVCGSYQEDLTVAQVIDLSSGSACPLPSPDPETGETRVASGICMTQNDCVEKP